MRIRKSCPLSCGMCRSNSTEKREFKPPPSQRIFHQFNRAIRPVATSKAPVTSAPLDHHFLFDRLNQVHQKGKTFSVAVPQLLVTDEAQIDGLKIASLGRLLTEAQAENELRECCRGNFISSDCLSLCSYNVEPQQIIGKALSRTCSERDANIWLRCVSAGNPNDGCCEENNVIGCENLCQGRFSVLELMTCIEPYLRPILTCHKDAQVTGKK
uniref:Domain of unknown function DB domain-containing protein n=1 Tax=Plectus sambesii TaxID=2011161 RepID=A0A914W5U9_9BILA